MPDERAHILLVDDRPENLVTLEAVLDQPGHQLVRATSGQEALRALLDEEFAVILLDVQLPGMDGFETAALIRTREQTRHTPIIFLTAVDRSDDQVARGYALGAVDYLFKPFDPDILKAKVQVFIDLYRKTREVKQLNAELEARVEERTRALRRTNGELQREIRERRRAEAAVRELNTELEDRVRERTAALEAANDDLKAFSYSVSHDLRAPLRRVEWFGKMLNEEYAGRLDDTGRQYLERLIASSRRMDGLIEDMLKLSMVGSREMVWEQVDLTDLVRQIVAELRAGLEDREVTFQVAEDVTVRGDPGLLRLALQNLLGNAIKFTGQRADARVTFGTTKHEGRSACFVQDNGIGFDMRTAGRLFEPFQRLHTSPAFPGTGIGLAIVRRVIRRHGGLLWAEAVPDEGATFYFTL